MNSSLITWVFGCVSRLTIGPSDSATWGLGLYAFPITRTSLESGPGNPPALCPCACGKRPLHHAVSRIHRLDGGLRFGHDADMLSANRYDVADLRSGNRLHFQKAGSPRIRRHHKTVDAVLEFRTVGGNRIAVIHQPDAVEVPHPNTTLAPYGAWIV